MHPCFSPFGGAFDTSPFPANWLRYVSQSITVFGLYIGVFHGCASIQHLVNQPVFHGFLTTQEIIAVRIPGDILDRLAGMVGQYLVQTLASLEDFLGMNLDIRGLPLHPAQRLVDHHP